MCCFVLSFKMRFVSFLHFFGSRLFAMDADPCAVRLCIFCARSTIAFALGKDMVSRGGNGSDRRNVLTWRG